MRLEIDPDIRRAATPPGAFYGDPVWYARQCERVLAPSWQLAAPGVAPPGPGEVHPFTLLPGSLDEPLLLARDEGGRLRVLSNVCTHRANLVVDAPGRCRGLRCRYHGRRFGLDGRFAGMPEFEGVEPFPTEADDLASLPVESFGPLLFTSLGRGRAFDASIAPVRERVEFLAPARFTLDRDGSRDYEIDAHWALYCDNYLEGFHIPFVHAALNATLDYGAYRTELFDGISLQTGIAGADGDAFDLPPDHPDAGRRVAAYYFFLFPNLMLNFYPWGLSLNLVEPLGPARTRVRFLTWVGDPSRRERGAGAGLHQVELEDEAVVESCQRGARSRLYRGGRYSTERERAVHHFHRALADALREGA